MSSKFNTINDMLKYYYGGGFVQKDADVVSTTTGVFNAVYGAMAFNQLNMEGNAFSILPKYPWPNSGFRAITGNAGATRDGGISEGAAVPATIKPTFQEIDVAVKEVAHVFGVSYRQEGLVKKSGDDAFGTMEQLRPYYASLHALRINQQLLTDSTTAAGTAFESIDRVTLSAAAATALYSDSTKADIYGMTRADNSWSDAQVSHNSGTDRTFSLSYVESLFGTLESAGARTNLVLTGPTTKWKIIGQAQTQVRYSNVVQLDVAARVGINGVQTEEGIGFGVRVASVYGVPMFSSQSVPSDTIPRIYLLDTTLQEGTNIPRLGIALLYPTLYFEAGMSAANPNPFTINKFATEGAFYTAGELVCTFFAAQGSIRDLQ